MPLARQGFKLFSWTRQAWIMVVLSVLLTACASAAESESTAAPVSPATEASVSANTEIPTVTAQPVVEPQAAPTPTRSLEELHASDPSVVELAGGQVQLVEFFAFW